MTAPRIIRVFISSTFSDMHAERDELIKRVFPRLRKLCEQRGVVWGEVDLRWGVTDEQRAEGQVLPICLEEIYKCRPYFIGLLGERYGWVPDSIAEELLEREPWLREQLANKKSVTELEILHGVLNNPDMAKHAFFYFRDPAFVERLPSTEDRARFVCENAIDAEKLRSLKARIKASPFPVREKYPDAVTLGQWIERDLTAVIDALYPTGTEPTPLDREAAEHEAFAQSRSRVYIRRREYFDLLDAHADGNGPPLVVLGESGHGKSALLANWALQYRIDHPDACLLMHFIGGTPYSADWAAMLRRILGEFNRRFDLGVEIPDKPDALRATFANALHMAAARGRIILILDALNQLEDRDGAPDLVWLPPVVPENVRLILSTLPGRPLDDLSKRGWPTLTIEPLSVEERKTLIADYLAQYRKSLSATRIERVATAEQTRNPLFLRALLEELRVFGVHEELDLRIDFYLAAREIDDLFELILARYEEDYERDRPGIVRDSMTHLWAARRGLTQSELLDLLGDQGEPLQQAYWSPLCLAMDHALIDRSGLIGFAHDYVRKAVQDRYLASENVQTEAHLRLANYFERSALEPRAIDELPWQLAEAKSWKKLSEILSNPRLFQAAWDKDEFEVKRYWARIEANSAIRFVNICRDVRAYPKNYSPEFIWRIALMLQDIGLKSEAIELWVYLREYFHRTGDKNSLQACLGNSANILYGQGDLDAAMALYKEAARLCLDLENKGDLNRNLGNQAAILADQGDLDEAMALYDEQERLCREANDVEAISWCIRAKADILYHRGEIDNAMTLYKTTERIFRELGCKLGLRDSLFSQAEFFFDRGDSQNALSIFQEQERVCREINDTDGLVECLSGKAKVLHGLGDPYGAMNLLKDAERFCRQLESKKGLQANLGRQAVILNGWGERESAMKLLQEQEQLCRQLRNKDWVQRSLGNQASILVGWGEYDRAVSLLQEQEQLCLEMKSKDGLQKCLCSQAEILVIRGEYERAMTLLKAQERYCIELRSKSGLLGCLGTQGNVLYALRDLDGAMALFKKVENLSKELRDKDGLQTSLCNQALILLDRGNLDGAMALLKEDENLCRELNKKVGLMRSLGNQALILSNLRDYDGAMSLLSEVESICRELKDKDGLMRTLAGRAGILMEQSNYGGALKLLREQEQMCRELSNVEGLATSLYNQAWILAGNLGRLREALPLAVESGSLARRHRLDELANDVQLVVAFIQSAGRF